MQKVLFSLYLSITFSVYASAQTLSVMNVTNHEGRSVSVDIASYKGAEIVFSDHKANINVNEKEKTIVFVEDLKILFLERENSYNKEISSYGYATFTPDEDVVVPLGVDAYIVSDIDQSSAITSLVEGDVIPAGEGVLLKAKEGSYSFQSALFPNFDVSSFSNNLLVGVTKDTIVCPYTIYTLGKEKSSCILGFWQYSGTKINKGTAYLQLDQNYQTRGFVINSEGTTNIKSVLDTNLQQPTFFDLNGAPISKSESGKIIINNGKKLLFQRK